MSRVIEQVAMKLAIPVDPAALFPSRLEQIDLPLVLTGTLAQGHPKPGIKPAGMDAEQATHHSHREPLLMLGNERVLHSLPGRRCLHRREGCIPGEIRGQFF